LRPGYPDQFDHVQDATGMKSPEAISVCFSFSITVGYSFLNVPARFVLLPIFLSVAVAVFCARECAL